MVPISAPARAMFGTTPEVESVIRRLEMPIPSPSATISRASRTASKLYSGSPMPIITTLVTKRPPSVGTMAPSGGNWPGQSPRRSRATMIWPTISPAVRLRTSRCVPVWQNEQVRVQPTWLDTHRVARPLSGM